MASSEMLSRYLMGVVFGQHGGSEACLEGKKTGKGFDNALDQGADAVAVGGDQHALARLDQRRQLFVPQRQHARHRVFMSSMASETEQKKRKENANFKNDDE